LMRRLPRTGFLHTHNIGLGKNPRLAYAVKLLAQQTPIRIINQIHDFPEDNRPAELHALRHCTGRRNDQFWRDLCYYDLPNVIWATLTTHDATRLAERGVPARKIHVLPNPVDDTVFSGPVSPRTETLAMLTQYARQHHFAFEPRRPFLLSPMKVMVRKNNEEAIELIKRLRNYPLVISLDASSPSDRAYSERLKRKIRRERLPVVIGAGKAFADPLPLFDIAHAVLTTSKVEGFGYAFLEGWLRRKLVFGRDIPEVTRDLIAAGMDLRHLYRELDDRAVQRISKLLNRPPRALIEKNRRVVLANYSLRAYARRYNEILGRRLLGRLN
jgi:glycosyltransferase involved in cell wall biosynthesis